MRIKEVGYIVERLADRFRYLGGQMAVQEAAHKTALAELRASFNARTASDEHRLENLREEIIRLNEAHGKTMVERDGLMTQVQDLRVALRKEQEAHDGLKQALGIQAAKEAGKVLGMANGEGLRSAAKRVIKERDDMRAALAKEQELHAATALRLSTEAAKLVERKHPVKVGAWVRRTDDECGGIYFGRGVIAQVLDVLDAPEHQYTVSRPEWNGYTVPWAMQYCEPCDPPTEATHDTPEGRSVAESVIRDSRSRDINDGDLVEVVSNTGRNTWLADVGSVGTVTSIETINDSISVRLDDVPGKKNVLAGYVSLCDVRKMTA